MTSGQFDGERYKNAQRRDWDQVAAAWSKWWSLFERNAQQVSDRLAAMAMVQAGNQVLDVSAGIGEPAATVAKLVGPGGSVVATDQAPAMLAVARTRMADLGLSNVELVEADTERLNVNDAEFDGAVCRWALMFLPDLQQGLSRIRRSIKPGGKFATSVWSTSDKVPFISLSMGVAQRVLDPPPPSPPSDAPNLFKLGAPGLIESAFEEAGFQDVQSEKSMMKMIMDSAEEFRDFMSDIAPPIHALVADRSDSVKAAFWDAVTDGTRAFETSDGGVSDPGEAILVVGTA